MSRFGFNGPTYQSQSPNVDAEECINFVPEPIESGQGVTSVALYGTEGLSTFATIGETGVAGLFYFNGRVFAAGANLWEIFLNGAAPVSYGSLGGPPRGPVYMAANPTQLLVCNNGNLFVLTLATNALVAVVNYSGGGAIPPIGQIGYTDAYFLAVLLGTNTFITSNLEDGTVWSALNIASVTEFPDPIASMIIAFREPWFLGQKKSTVYYNAGAGFPPFIPIQGALLENGSSAQNATVQLDNSIFWLDGDERGGLIARRASGYTPIRVSNFAVEYAWQQYTKTSDAVGYSYQANGHSYWVIYFPTANKTWVYDVATGMWHKRAFWNNVNGVYQAHRSQCHCYVESQMIHLVGDYASGNIYKMSLSNLTDFGNVIRRIRRAPTVSNEQSWMFHKSLQVYSEMGMGPELVDAQGKPRAPQMGLRWSDDGAHTWKNTQWKDAGKVGEFRKRAIWRRLGRSRGRTYELIVDDPVPWRIVDSYLDAGGAADYKKPNERLTDQYRKVS